jgi:hypothetical protein
MPVNYNRNEWLSDLFPDGNAPRTMSTVQYEELKQRHQEMMRQRDLEKQRIDELKRKEWEKILEQKDQITYSDQLAQEICERVSAGELLINICLDHHMPTMKRCNVWLKSNQDFAQLFSQAIQDRLSIFEEEIIKIADDATQDFKEVTIKKMSKRVLDPEVISRAKLRIDVRFRHLRAGRPNKWGEQSTLITKNNEDDPAELTNEELERRINEIEAKDRTIHRVK